MIGPDAEEPSKTKPRLLVVPHIYADNIAVREIELARRLTSHFDVFVMKWRDAMHVESRSKIARRFRQIAVALGASLHFKTRLETPDRLTLLEPSVWQPLLFQKFVGSNKALSICQRYNRRTFRRIVSQFRIRYALMASELFDVKRIRGVRTFFDIVDWFPEENASPKRLQQIRANLRAIGMEADGMFAVSEGLTEKLKRECGIQALPLPNGADLSRLRNVDRAAVQALRERLGVRGKFVIGYIGNHGPYTGVDLVMDSFLAARSRLPDAALLVVGPADHWRKLLEANSEFGVIAPGNIPPAEMPVYFNAIDLGVLAQGRSTGTDFAFQIKVVEYTACRKCVVSTPLLNWQRLAWPNVLLTEADPAAWADAFVQARSMRWQPAWDRYVEAYDWSTIAAKTAEIMLNEV